MPRTKSTEEIQQQNKTSRTPTKVERKKLQKQKKIPINMYLGILQVIFYNTIFSSFHISNLSIPIPFLRKAGCWHGKKSASRSRQWIFYKNRRPLDGNWVQNKKKIQQHQSPLWALVWNVLAETMATQRITQHNPKLVGDGKTLLYFFCTVSQIYHFYFSVFVISTYRENCWVFFFCAWIFGTLFLYSSTALFLQLCENYGTIFAVWTFFLYQKWGRG